MTDVKTLNRLLWAVNVLLGAGIVVFSFQYLLRAQDPKEYMSDFKPDDDSPAPPVRNQNLGEDGALRTLTNPVERREKLGPGAIPDVPFKATLKGTLPSEKDPKSAVAFLRSPGRNADLVAYVGEEILHEGKPFEEYRGWTLESVSRESAVFVSRKNERVTLMIDQSITPPPTGSAATAALAPVRNQRIGAAYMSEAYKSRLLAAADTRQVWGIDQDEIEWAAQNAAQILDRDLQVSPYAGGGLRIEGVTPGSIGASRGLLAGDVLREVNGQPLNNVGDMHTMMDSNAFKSQTGLRLTIERAGKPVVIEYRPLPR